MLTKMNIYDRLRLYADRDRSECWNWPGKPNAAGYGVTNLKRDDGIWIPEYVHRIAYAVFVGPIPDGFTVDHLCRNRACFNPSHLEAVTMGENVRRAQDFLRPARRSRTHCRAGHEFTAGNTIRLRSGRLTCRACMCQYKRRYYERKRAALGKTVVHKVA